MRRNGSRGMSTLVRQRMSNRCVLPFLLLFVSSVYLYTATSRALLDDGDALYAAVALQMLERGDYVTPVVNGVRFLDKPPMMYWLMALSYAALGPSEFAARLPTVLAVAGTACLLFLLAAGSAGRTSGLFAGIASAMCVGTFLFTRMVFPDMLLVFFLTLAMYAFWRWYRNPAGPVVPALAFYTALAGGVLTKGLVGILFPAATIVIFLWWSREVSLLKHFHLGKGILLFLVLSLPWHVSAAIRTPDFLWYFLVNEQILRFLGRRTPADYESISLPLFWLLSLVWLFPWSAFLPGVRSMVRDFGASEGGVRPLIRLSLCWAAVVLGFFTVSSRIEHYSLPLIPPLSLLVGMMLSPARSTNELVGVGRNLWIDRGFAALAWLGALAGGAPALAYLLSRGSNIAGESLATRHAHAYQFYFAPLFDLPPQMLEGLRTPFLGACATLALGFLAAWRANRNGRRSQAVAVLACVMAAFNLFAFQSLGICEDAISSRQFGRELNRLYRPGDTAITFGDYEAANSLNFYAPMPLEVVEGTAAVLSWGLRYPDAPRRVLSRTEFESRWKGPTRIFLLVPDTRLPGLHLNRSYEVMRSGGRTLICSQPLGLPAGHF